MKGFRISYSDAELAWIKANSTLPRRQAHAEFCEIFGRTDVAFHNFKSLCTRKGWITGRTGHFEEGHAPANKGRKMPFNANSAKTQFKKGNRSGKALEVYKPIGTERLSKEGYVERKINDDMPLQSRWRRVHLIRWEAEYGPLPEGMCLKCLDGDKVNTDPSNWRAIPRSMLPRLNGKWAALAYDDAPPELKPTIMATAELEYKARELRKSRGKEE